MNTRQEWQIRDAIRTGDGQLLADTVRQMKTMDYYELQRFVEQQPGGQRALRWYGIRVGDVEIIDRAGKPVVRWS